jgi:hypothetical protein
MMVAELIIALVLAVSAFFIFQSLKQIAEHLLQIRLACWDMNARYKMRADSEAREWLSRHEPAKS